jgi:hypothetical protein
MIMTRTFGAGLMAVGLALAALAQPAAAQYPPPPQYYPPPPPPPPDPAAPVGGAIAGGVIGGLIGGALGRGPGAVAGAVIGGTTGAVIASEAQARPGGYFWWHGGCYYRYPNGVWSQPLYPTYCGY